MNRVPSPNKLSKIPTGSLILFVRAKTGKRAAAKLMSVSLHDALLKVYLRELRRRGITGVLS